MSDGRMARLRQGLGIDFHIAMTLLLRGWAAGAGLITVLAITAGLTSVEQGYYFTFSTLIAMQVFFELGLNQVVTQIVSHEAAHLRVGENGALHGDPRAAARVAGLVHLLRRWYLVAAVVFAVVVGAVGFVLFDSRGELGLAGWLPAWLLLVVATAANLRLSPMLAIAEGVGQVGQVARVRLLQSMLGYLTLWAVMLAGGGLWAVAAVPLAASICTGIWLRKRARPGEGARGVDAISWRREVLPFQWRIGISWVSGYFIFSLFTPVIFARHGSVQAGRVGLALTVFQAISTIGLSWVNAKVPEMGRLVARGESSRLRQLFFQVTVRSTLFVSLACSMLVVVSWCASRAELGLVDRIAAPAVLALIAAATVANALIYACAAFMRAHREEPMLAQSVFSAVAVGMSVVLIEPTTSMFVAYVAVIVAVAVPWTAVLLRRYLGRHDPAVRELADG